MSYTVALSIQRLMAEMLAKWPNSGPLGTYRSPADAVRLGNADSDHVPWLNNTVRALDIGTSRTVPAMALTGDTMSGLAEFLRGLGAAGDPRLNGGGYVIWNRRIATAKGGWAWRVYSGSNPHTDHIHLSVSEDPAGYNSSAPWGIQAGDFDLGVLPVGDDGVPGSSGANPYVAAGPGSVTVPSWDNVAWQPRGDYRCRTRVLTVEAASWVGQRTAAVVVTGGTGDPTNEDSGQPRRSRLTVTDYEVTNTRSSGFMVNFSVSADHVFYDAHWNIGIWAADAATTRLPRPGFEIEGAWQLMTQLQVLDGVGLFAGQIFTPSPRFTLALLSDWSAYGDLRPDILDGETRSREARMEVLSIEAYDLGIGGPLGVGASLVYSDFEGKGEPGTMDITRPAGFDGGGCV